MHHLRFVILTICALAFAILRAQAQTTPEAAGDEFFRGYRMKNEAERLAQAGDLERALEKYQQAQSIYDAIATNQPFWQTDMLTQRRQLLTTAIDDLKAKIAARPAPAPVPVPAPVSTTPPPGAATPAQGFVPPAPAAPQTGAAPSLSEAFETMRRAIDSQSSALQQQLLEAQAKIGQYAMGYEQMLQQRDLAVKQRDEFYLKSESLKQSVAAQEKKIAELEQAVKNGGASKADLDKARRELTEFQDQLADYKQRAAKAEQVVMEQAPKLAESSMQLASIEKERDTLRSQIAALQKENESLKRRVVPENMKALAEENDRLKAELEAARKQVITLQDDVSRKDAEIGQLRSQLTSIQGELAALRKENAAYESQLAELTVELKKIKDRAADPKESKGDDVPVLMAENQLLKGVIMRQLRMQARQQEQKRLLIQEIQKTENASRELIDQVEQLAGSRLTLTAEEQKLFTAPQLEEMLGAEGIKGTIIGEAGKARPPAKNDDEAKKLAALNELIDRGNRQRESKQFDEAASTFQEVLRADPKNSTGLAGLAWTRVQQNKLEDAEATLKKWLAFEPENSVGHYMLAVTHFRRDKFTEAMASFEKSLSIDPKQARAHHYLGVIASKMGITERAEREFKGALAVDPSYGEADFNLAVLYATSSPPRWDEARKHYAEAIKKGGTPDPALEKLLKQPENPQPKKTAAAAKQ